VNRAVPVLTRKGAIVDRRRCVREVRGHDTSSSTRLAAPLSLGTVSAPRVHAVPVPDGGLVAVAFPHIDYADAFGVALPSNVGARALAEAAFASSPWWVGGLMALRNALVRPLGLVANSSALARAALAANGTGERTGIFPVVATAPDEVLLGFDDRHLDFRISVRTFSLEDGRLGVVTTLVRFRGALGRAYFIPVRPAHRLIVPVMLRRGVRSLAMTRG